MDPSLTLWGLFATAFLSSTLLPGGSEVLVVALGRAETSQVWVLLTVASLGNTLGGMTSWLIGRLIARRYPADQLAKAEYRKALQRLGRWGSGALLFSWVPVIGDPLCVAAGWLRVNGWVALALIALGKTARYAAILWMV